MLALFFRTGRFLLLGFFLPLGDQGGCADFIDAFHLLAFFADAVFSDLGKEAIAFSGGLIDQLEEVRGLCWRDHNVYVFVLLLLTPL